MPSSVKFSEVNGIRNTINHNLVKCSRLIIDAFEKDDEHLLSIIKRMGKDGDAFAIGCFNGILKNEDLTIWKQGGKEHLDTPKGRRICYYVIASRGFEPRGGDYIVCRAVSDIDADGKAEIWQKMAIYKDNCKCLGSTKTALIVEKEPVDEIDRVFLRLLER